MPVRRRGVGASRGPANAESSRRVWGRRRIGYAARMKNPVLLAVDRLRRAWLFVTRPSLDIGALADRRRRGAARILLVEQTYCSGWQPPGRAACASAKLLTVALRWKPRAEVGVEPTAPPRLLGVDRSFAESKSDYVAVLRRRAAAACRRSPQLRDSPVTRSSRRTVFFPEEQLSGKRCGGSAEKPNGAKPEWSARRGSGERRQRERARGAGTAAERLGRRARESSAARG